MAICGNGGTKVSLSLRVPIYRAEAISVGQGDCRVHF
jgi:hypothetical protein